MAKNDGRGFKQRMWFRGEPSDIDLIVQGEYYTITAPLEYKEYDDDTILYLTYNNGENTILGKYFNIDLDSTSDALEIEVYLTPKEYKLIKNGASVLFDDNVYKCSKIDGFDASGVNPTKLTLISF